MSVVLCVYGNHSIAFDGKELADKQDVLNRLNSLKFEDSEFLLEMCKVWHSYKREKLEQDLQINSWSISCEYDYNYPHTKEYIFIGPYGLEIVITQYYISISPWVGRYVYWYDVTGEENIKWRDTWRLIIYKIIHVLGGDRALYFPDNLYELSGYVPTDYDMPEFNQMIQIISEEYSAPFTSFAEAAKWYVENELAKAPFIIDRFEDVIENKHLLLNGKTETQSD
jgi:hypothetical protein